MQLRIASLRERAREMRPLLLAARLLAPNEPARQKARATADSYTREFGPASGLDRLKAAVVLAASLVEVIRHGLARCLGRRELVRQPPMRRFSYRCPDEAGRCPSCAGGCCR